MTPTIKSIRLANGITLQYAESGNPAGVPVIFLHGYTDSRRSFEAVLPHLPGSIRALCPTQRGHGDSDKPATGYAMRDFAGDVAAFMDGVDIDRAVIAGHSMGTAVALRLAVDHPERVEAMALMGTFFSFRANAVVRDLWDSAVCHITDPVSPAFARDFQNGTLARPVPAAFLDMVVGESLKVPARVWREALKGQLQSDVSGDLARIRVPVLLQWGERETLIPHQEQEALLSLLPDARLITYPDAGHGVHWDEPASVARDLAAFIAALPRRPDVGNFRRAS
jgi:pimeloyl-ACP methyl ester carboxylesterase